MAEFFGYEIKRKKEAASAQSFVAPSDEDGTLDIACLLYTSDAADE